MKIILLCLILSISGMAGAQIVNIPDSEMKSALLNGLAKNNDGEVINIDTNNDYEIQINEAEAVWELDLFPVSSEITSLQGLEAFINLRKLNLQPEILEEFNVLLPNLEELVISEAHIMEVMNLQALPMLKSFTCYSSFLQIQPELDFSGLPQFETLIVWDSYLPAELELNGLEALNKIELDGVIDGIEMLKISNLLSLEHLFIDSVNLSTLEISGVPALLSFHCTDLGQTTELDLSSAGLLEDFELIANENLSYLKLKNGKAIYSEFNLQYSSPNFYVCIDDGEEIYFEDAIQNGAVVNSYCTYTPGGGYNSITGRLTFDNDTNGCDSSDPASFLTKIILSNGTLNHTRFTSMEGTYNYFTEAGTFTLTPEFENDWFTVTPASATVTLATVDNSTTTQDFCITANGVHPDLGALITSVVTAQPGFDATYRIVYFNKGNQTISGSVFFSFDDATMDYVSALPAEDFTSGNLRGWNYTDLMPFESRSILVTLNTNSPQEDPAVNIGDMLPFSVTVMPTTGDETPDDNQFLYDEMVTGSFDPNDITCLEGEVAGPDMIGEYLHYNINFENTGDAAATFIVVKQVIDEAQFEVGSLQPLNTSHDVKVKVDGNVVEYRFDDIDLGPLEKGNIVFKIKSLSSLQVGDDVMQKAEIFFDYNWPILTNEAVTVFEVLGIGDFELDATVKIYPNPVKDNLNITAGHDLKTIELYDLQGRLLQTTLVKGTDATLNLSGRAAGIYFVKVTTEKGVKVEKIINE